MRSGKHAAKLQKEGVKVKNLKGSIIAWVNVLIFVAGYSHCIYFYHLSSCLRRQTPNLCYPGYVT